MKIKVNHSPLDEGEKWQEENSRQIECCQSSEKDCVYFGIYKIKKNGRPRRQEKQQVIVQDFFLSPSEAKLIGMALIHNAMLCGTSTILKSSKKAKK